MMLLFEIQLLFMRWDSSAFKPLSDSETFNDIVEKVQGKIKGWRAKSLSQANRLVLIKLVTSSIPTYAISTFLLANRICGKLDN
jgi:hypothetical protein